MAEQRGRAEPVERCTSKADQLDPNHLSLDMLLSCVFLGTQVTSACLSGCVNDRQKESMCVCACMCVAIC